MEEDIIEDLSKKYDEKENLIKSMWIKAKECGYNIIEFEELVEQFYLKK